MTWFDRAIQRLAEWKAGEQPDMDAINFTPRATRALALAREEAGLLNQNFVGTEHVLLGLIGLGQGVSVNILYNLGFDLENVRKEIEQQRGAGAGEKISENIPYTPRTRNVLARAREEARILGHPYTGTEHLLLGLLGETDGLAWRIFKQANVDFQKTRQEILKILTAITQIDPPPKDRRLP